MASTPVFRASSGASATGTASTATVTIPSAVQVGDVMVAVVAYKLFIGSGVLNTPAGWTELAAPQNGPAGNTMQGAVYYKVAVSGDTGGSTTVTFNATAGTQQINVAFAAYDLAGATPRSFSWNTSSTTAATTITHTAPATTPVTGDLVLVVAAIRGSTNGGQPTFTGSGGPTVRAQSVNVSGSAQNVGAYIGDHNDTNATRNVTATVASWWVSGQVILVPGTVALDRGISETLTAADTPSRTVARPRDDAEGVGLADSTGASVVLGRATGETLTLVDAATRNVVGIALAAEALGLGDAVTRGATAYARAAAEAIALGDTFGQVLAQSRATGEALGLADASSRTTAPVVATADALTASDAWTYVTTQAVGASDTVTVADAAGRALAFGRAPGEGLQLADGWATGLGVMSGISQGLTLADAFDRAVGRPRTEQVGNLSFDDDYTSIVAGGSAVGETVGLADANEAGRVVLVGADEDLGLADELARASTEHARGTGEQVGLGEATGRLVDRSRAAAEALTLADDWQIGRGLVVGVAEQLGVADTWGRTRNVARALAEALGLADAVARSVSRGRGIAQALGMADSWAAGRFLLVGTAEAVQLADAVVRGYAAGRTAAETMALGNTISRSAIARARGITEFFTIGFSATAGAIVQTGTAETVAVDDELTRSATTGGRAIAEAMVLGHVFTRAVARSRDTAGSMTFSDVWLAAREIIPTTAASEMAFSDAVSARTARARAAGGNTVAMSNTVARLIDRARPLVQTLTLADVVAAIRGQHAGMNGAMSLDHVVAATTARGVTAPSTILILDFAGVGDAGGPLVIAHYHRADMTERPHGRTRMTAPPRGTVRRTV